MHNEAWTAHGADLDCKNFARADEGDCFDLRPLPGGNRAYDPAVQKALAGSSVCLSRSISESHGDAGQSSGVRTNAGGNSRHSLPNSRWCPDDKYPIELVVDKIVDLVSDIVRSADVSGLLFCRCKALLRRPEATLDPQPRINSFGDVYLERKGWHQIWIHQFLRVKVLRFLFSQMPERIASAKLMDTLKDQVPKLAEHRLFVTRENFAIFGESTHKGTLNRNCYESIKRTKIELPKWFRKPNHKYVTLGKLEGQSTTTQSR
jgi:hypothetical protein